MFRLHLHKRKRIPAGMTLLWLLLMLLSAAFLTAFSALGAAYDRNVSETLERYPLALPDAVILPELPPDETDLASLNSVGRGTVGALYPCRIDGQSVLLAGLPRDAYPSVFSCEDPDSVPHGLSCAVFPLKDGSLPGPGSTLAVPAGILDSTALTVSAQAENPLSALLPFPEISAEYDYILCTDLTAWNPEARDENACILVTYGSARSRTEADKALRSVSDAGLSARKTRYRAAMLASLEEAEASEPEPVPDVSAADASVLRERLAALDRQLSELEAKIPAAEQAFLEADSALERARQAFNSEMEYHEYYAANQTGLIEAKAKAEAEFAGMQSVADDKLAALGVLYAARLDAQTEREQTAASLAALADADIPDSGPDEPEQPAVPVLTDADAAWKIMFSSESAFRKALPAYREKALLPVCCAGAVLVLLSALLLFGLCYRYRMPRGILFVLPLCMLFLCLAIGILSGMSVLAGRLYPLMFSSVSAVPAVQPLRSFALLLPLFLPIGAGVLGAVLRAKKLRDP